MVPLLLALSAPAHAVDCDTLADRLYAVRDAELVCATPALWAAVHDLRAAGCDLEALGALGLPDPVKATHERRRGTGGGGKVVRDAFGIANVHETTNFAVRWGSFTGFDMNDIVGLGDAFEEAWSVEVADGGYPQPDGAATHKFNVYVGDSGGGTPSALGNAGYFWYDDDGWPMIVIAANQLSQRDFADLTSSHEFFHAVQAAIDTFQYDTRGAWYAEATASWIENQVHPSNPGYAGFLWFFAARPELAVNHFEYPSTGATEEFHQYGAFVFVEHLADRHGGPDLIQRSYLEAPFGGDPLRELDDLLAEDGDNLRDSFFAFAARNGTWDYAHGDWFDWYIDAYGGYTGDAHRPSGTLSGETDWVEPAADLPRTYGANYWRLRDLPDRPMLHFDGTVGPDGPAAWHVAVSWRDGSVHDQEVLVLAEGVGSLDLADLGVSDASEAWVVVAAAQGFVDTGEAWTYALRIESLADPEPEPEDGPKTCGCATPGPAQAPWALLALSLAVASRRRRWRSR